MAVLKRSLRRKNATGNYDTIRLESDSSIVYRPSGRTVEQDLAAYLPSTQSSDVVPKTLSFGKILTGTNKIWYGKSDSAPIELITTLNLEENSGSSGGNGYPSDEFNIIELGNYVYFKGYEWLVCHEISSTRTRYLITKDIIKSVQWNTTDTTSGGYTASNIKRECTRFANTLGVNSLNYVINTGVGKVFIPTEEQMTGESGGFSYFDSNSKRIAKLNGSASIYWTATPYGSSRVWRVDSDGDIDNRNYASYSNGFRPCIAIKY